MPVKHIPDKTWRKVQDEIVKAVIETKTTIKDATMIEFLINQGLENTTKEDYKKLVKNKNDQ